MRYSYTDTHTIFNGKRAYKSTLYPNIQEDDSDIYVTAAENDYLDGLSYRYYGSEKYWWVIAVANNIMNGRLSVPVGKQIRIPGNLDRIIQDLKNIN